MLCQWGYRDFVQVLAICTEQVPAGRRINFEGQAFASKAIMRRNTSDHAVSRLCLPFPLNNSEILEKGPIIPPSVLLWILWSPDTPWSANSGEHMQILPSKHHTFRMIGTNFINKTYLRWEYCLASFNYVKHGCRAGAGAGIIGKFRLRSQSQNVYSGPKSEPEPSNFSGSLSLLIMHYNVTKCIHSP